MLVPHEWSQDALIGPLTQPILVVPVTIHNYYFLGSLLVDFEGLAQIIAEQGKRLEGQISALSDRMVDRFSATDGRLTEIERRLSNTESDLKAVRDDLHALDKQVTRNFWWLVVTILGIAVVVHIPAVRRLLGLL